ncbi:hypothetical protein [Paucibacter soli]
MRQQQLMMGHGHRFLTAMKAMVLVAAVWGLVYPALLWILERALAPL